MKIGEFSKMCEISKDTVRYYVNIGLLVPKMKDGNMDFTDREIQDYLFIRRWKNMQFSIQEIKAFLYLRRISNMIEPATIDECLSLLQTKEDSLLQEIENLKESVSLIREERTLFEKRRMVVPEKRGGVPLSMIPNLCCPHCRKQLMIENASINGKYIYSGDLKCNCGYTAKIEKGIVMTGNQYHGNYDTPDLSRKLYEEVGEEYTNLMQECAERILETKKKQDWSHKVILETNINGRFFTYNYFERMPKDASYIFVDKYPEVLLMYKEWIDTLWPEMDVLYIADASEKYPLKEQCVDVFISFTGENEYSFYHKNMQITDIKEVLKENTVIVGGFQSLPEHSQSRKNLMEHYPEGNREMFILRLLEDAYRNAGAKIETFRLGDVKKTKKHHCYLCHQDGEPISIIYYERNTGDNSKEKERQ